MGIKKLHFFESIRQPGFVGIRERSCHQCTACATGAFEQCENNARCGCYRVLELSPKTGVIRASTRRVRENGALEFAEHAKAGDFFASDHTWSSSENFIIYAVAKDSCFREADEDQESVENRSLQIRKGDFVIDAIRFACVSAGGTVFTPTALEVVVPVKAILSFGLSLALIEPRRVFRHSVGNIEKWQMSRDDHAKVLLMISETLDDVVSHAVETVSGRS